MVSETSCSKRNYVKHIYPTFVLSRHLTPMTQEFDLFFSLRLAQDLREKRAAITIQRYYRGFVCRKQFVTIRAAIVIIQCFTRGMFARRLRMQLLYEAKTKIIQRCWRRYRARENYRNYKKTIVYLQSCVRRMIARRELKQLKVIHVEMRGNLKISIFFRNLFVLNLCAHK